MSSRPPHGTWCTDEHRKRRELHPRLRVGESSQHQATYRITRPRRAAPLYRHRQADSCDDTISVSAGGTLGKNSAGMAAAAEKRDWQRIDKPGEIHTL